MVKPEGVMKVKRQERVLVTGLWHCRPVMQLNAKWSEAEHICCDPKDGELCLRRVKSEETLMEARSDSDVQIDRQTWV